MMLRSRANKTPALPARGRSQEASDLCKWNGAVQMAFWSPGRLVNTFHREIGSPSDGLELRVLMGIEVGVQPTTGGWSVQTHSGSCDFGGSACTVSFHPIPMNAPKTRSPLIMAQLFMTLQAPLFQLPREESGTRECSTSLNVSMSCQDWRKLLFVPLNCAAESFLELHSGLIPHSPLREGYICERIPYITNSRRNKQRLFLEAG